MTTSLTKIGKALKTIPCPFVLEWHNNTKEHMCIVFSDDEYMSLTLDHPQVISIPSRCNRYLFEHNVKESDFKTLALELKSIILDLTVDEFKLFSNLLIIKTASQAVYLTAKAHYDNRQFVDLTVDTFPESFHAQLIEC